MFIKSALVVSLALLSSATSVGLPPVGGIWAYGGGADGSAKIIVSEKENLEIRLHWHARKRAGQAEPHYILNAQARKSSENGTPIWPFDGTWLCSASIGCEEKCSGGKVSGIVRSGKIIEISYAENECKHNLSGLTLVK